MRHLVLLTCLLASACAGRNSALTKASTELSGAPADPAKAAPAEGAEPAESATEPKGSERPEPTADFYSPAQPRTATKPAPANTANTSRPASGGSSGDDPKISRSAGKPGGVVVLWPRVIPTDITDMNRRLVQEIQTQLRVVVQRTAAGKPLDVRPEPERVCRRSGCEATSVSVLFTRHGDGCAVVALVTPPGPVETTLVPWAGGVELSRTQIPFRDAPESYIKVKDLARCSELTQIMRQNDAAVEAAIRAAIP
jgi:hypothetical protein